MNAIRSDRTNPATQHGSIAERILDAFPSGSYALTALLRLMDIVESTAVPTAAVECRIQPRLLVNPAFVAAHARTPEKLLVLVMHELHHVLLGHTTLFPRVTPVQNFVFDAVINGLVCRMFPDADYTRFFTDYYSAAAFPECLLRPPPGWPDNPITPPGIASLPERQRRRVTEIHRSLYSAAGATYQEVFEALPKLLDEGAVGGIPLLGGHAGEGAPDGELEHRSPVLFDVVRGLVEQWPQPPDPIRGRSLDDLLESSRVEPPRPRTNRAALRGLILKVAGVSRAGSLRRLDQRTLAIQTPIPTLGRRSLVLRALGHEPLLHQVQTTQVRPTRTGERVHVYLDVSGSMDAIKGALYGAVLDCEYLVDPTVHLFSSQVADISLAELRRGVCRSTGGTDIGCVAEHMARHRVRRAVLVTDGWVGLPRGGHREVLARAKLGIAYLGTNVAITDLAAVANHTVNLTIEERS